MTDPRVDDIAERIGALAEELDEVMFDLLREAVADGATQRPALDKRLTQARRALERARHALQD